MTREDLVVAVSQLEAGDGFDIDVMVMGEPFHYGVRCIEHMDSVLVMVGMYGAEMEGLNELNRTDEEIAEFIEDYIGDYETAKITDVQVF